MEPVNTLAARDVRSVIHPFTDLAHHVEEGPMVLTRGEGGSTSTATAISKAWPGCGAPISASAKSGWSMRRGSR